MGRNLKVRAHYTRGVRRFGPGFVGPLFIGRPHSVASYLVRAAVRAAAPVNMVSFIMQGGCQCENAPGLRIGTSNVEIAAMMAPRPMLLVSATGDWTRNVPREEYPAIRSIYELYKQPDNVTGVQIGLPPGWRRGPCCWSRRPATGPAMCRAKSTPPSAPSMNSTNSRTT